MRILAYIDAGSGSLIIQLLAGGLAGLVAFFKFRWSSIGVRQGRAVTAHVDDPSDRA